MQALWMVLAALLFATMSVCIKLAAADFTVFEIVLARGLSEFPAISLANRGPNNSLQVRI